ncbi:TonB-dependent receptor [Chitinophaga horti]|uniref:TonB-dependent receptor n=1 Tax=Chitinophaga horti TaxID=2920382 RepID=A0ABY6IZ19_9BACT|nr:TonB-dependent receptor [Chitinophaga horti]UYQ92637.1 TonB-dependent receptor [Chitinophaga horti]
MKLTVLLMTIAMLQVQAASYGQTVSLAHRKVPLEKVFSDIRKQTGYSFLYTDEQLSRAHLVTLHVRNVPLKEALDRCFSEQPLTYLLTGNTIIIKRKEAVSETSDTPLDDVTIRGRITDDKGQPIPGAMVRIKGTQRGVVTNENGEYSIQAPNADAVLLISSLGFTAQEVVAGGRTSINFELTTAVSNIDQLVVIGYGQQKKGTLTNAISTISVKEFEEAPVNRLDQVLQGRSPGVTVTNATGAPGGSVRIRIRGSNSINGDNGPLYVVDGFVGAEFFAINPDEIESLQILKDASATAIYGSRGSNGVIIVTTKKGTAGAIKVNLTTRQSLSTVIKKMDLLNAGDFAATANARAAVIGTTAPFSEAQIAEFKTNGGTNWQDEIFRTALSQEYLLNLSGGTEKGGYFISGDYLDQDGILKNSSFKRYSVRSNIHAKLTDKLTATLNINGAYSSAQNIDIVADGPHSPISQAITWSPTLPVRTTAGGYTVTDPISSVFFNPVALTTDQLSVTDRMLANMIGGFKYDDIIPGLSFNLQYGVNYLGYDNKSFAGKVVNTGTSTASLRSNKEIRLQNSNTLNYQRKFGNHRLEVTGVAEYQQSTYNYMSAGASNLTYEKFMWNNLAQGTAGNPGSGYSKWSIFSLAGRAVYNFKDKYLASAAIRRDASSKFAGGNKNSYFPSVSAGWVLSEEAFLKQANIFSLLKIRGSWGLTGSEGVGPYNTFSAYSNRVASFNNSTSVTGIVLNNIGNPELKWETTEQKNIGVEMGIMNNRFLLTADLFQKDTRDLLLNETLPFYLGGNPVTRNVGSVQNKGFEIALEGMMIDKGAFTWNSWLNFSYIKNRVQSIGNSAIIFDATRKIGGGMSLQPEFVVRPGDPLGAIWGLTYLGTWKPGDETKAGAFGAKPGDSRYFDKTDDGTIDADDYDVIGNGVPVYSFGFNNTFNYKNFSLNFLVHALAGFDKLNYNNAATMFLGGDAREATHVDIKNRYIPGVNETSNIPAFSTTNRNFTQSTRFLEKADFIRLKNISLAYTVPKAKIANKMSVRVFVSATNLFTITGYSGIDPEASSAAGDIRQGIDYGAYPNSKTYTAGLTLSL